MPTFEIQVRITSDEYDGVDAIDREGHPETARFNLTTSRATSPNPAWVASRIQTRLQQTFSNRTNIELLNYEGEVQGTIPYDPFEHLTRLSELTRRIQAESRQQRDTPEDTEQVELHVEDIRRQLEAGREIPFRDPFTGEVRPLPSARHYAEPLNPHRIRRPTSTVSSDVERIRHLLRGDDPRVTPTADEVARMLELHREGWISNEAIGRALTSLSQEAQAELPLDEDFAVIQDPDSYQVQMITKKNHAESPKSEEPKAPVPSRYERKPVI